jgi:hypothetical protein
MTEYLEDPKKWLRMDYLSYYTHWSGMHTLDYSNEHDFFNFYMASGEMTPMFQWFTKGASNIDNSVAKIVTYIWKRVHHLVVTVMKKKRQAKKKMMMMPQVFSNLTPSTTPWKAME